MTGRKRSGARRAAIAAGVVVAAAILLGAAVRLLVPWNRLTESGLRRLSARAGASFTVDAASVAWRPLPCWTLSGVGWRGAVGNGAGAGTLEAACVAIDVRPRWRSLLARRFELAGVSVRGGSVVWRGADGRDVRIAGLSGEVEPDDPLLLRERWLAFVADGAGAPQATREARAAFDAHADSVTLTGFSAAGPLVLRGVALTGAVSLTPDAANLDASATRISWGGIVASASATVARTPAGRRLRGKWRLLSLDPAALVASLEDVLPALDADARTRLRETTATLGSCDMSGAWDLDWPPTERRWRDALGGLTLDAAVSELRIAPPAPAPAWTVSAKVALRGTGATFDEVVIEPESGRLTGGAALTGLDTPAPRCRFRLRSEAVPARLLLDLVAPQASPYLEGATDADLSGTLALGPADTLRATADVAGKVVIRGGVLHASSWMADIAPYLGDRQDLQEVRFHALRDSVVIRDGRLTLGNLRLDGPDTDWRGSGWLGLDGGIDMRLAVRFPRDFHPQLGSLTPFAALLRDSDGRLTLSFTLTGRASRPDVALDLSALGRGR